MTTVLTAYAAAYASIFTPDAYWAYSATVLSYAAFVIALGYRINPLLRLFGFHFLCRDDERRKTLHPDQP